MAVVVESSSLNRIKPALANVALVVLNVRVPCRFDNPAPLSKTTVFVSVLVALMSISSVAPFLTVILEPLMFPSWFCTKSRPLLTVMAPIALLPVARFKIRSFPPVENPPPPVMVPLR